MEFGGDGRDIHNFVGTGVVGQVPPRRAEAYQAEEEGISPPILTTKLDFMSFGHPIDLTKLLFVLPLGFCFRLALDVIVSDVSLRLPEVSVGYVILRARSRGLGRTWRSRSWLSATTTVMPCYPSTNSSHGSAPAPRTSHLLPAIKTFDDPAHPGIVFVCFVPDLLMILSTLIGKPELVEVLFELHWLDKSFRIP